MTRGALTYGRPESQSVSSVLISSRPSESKSPTSNPAPAFGLFPLVVLWNATLHPNSPLPASLLWFVFSGRGRLGMQQYHYSVAYSSSGAFSHHPKGRHPKPAIPVGSVGKGPRRNGLFEHESRSLWQPSRTARHTVQKIVLALASPLTRNGDCLEVRPHP